MSNWQQDKSWADAYLPYVKRVCGAHLIGEAPQEEDAERNTDLIVLRMDAVRIACRIRRPTYAARYSHEFTIRCTRPNGTKTELAKIVEGWGDYIFYGFGMDSSEKVSPWILGDLKVFRAWYVEQLRANGGEEPGYLQENRDGSSDFRAFNIAEMPKSFVVAQSAAKVKAKAA